MRYISLLGLLGLLCSCGPDLPQGVALAYEGLPQRVDFNQHIRPILSDRCYSCHGPDAAARQAGLRLDRKDDLFVELTQTGRTPVVPGKPGQSELVHRILSDDPAVMMPTPESHLALNDKEKALLVRWIEDGATWKDHWAFLPIEDPAVPADPAGYPAAATPVDNFINARLSEEHLAAAGPAQPEVLLRRLYLDLTGLPPSLEELDEWLADPSEEAYRARVEELLQTDAYAERMTMEWLDVARYADSHGLHADGLRTSWPYRDWVIAAFKRNLPYDDFIRWQLAGDLIDEPTQESRLATAFLRMNPMTSEGGAIAEEFRLGYVFDRVNTVSTGLLGLTMECSRCHDHKFDPLSQEEYYSFSAFFNTIEELGMTANDGDFGPLLVISDDKTNQLLQEIGQEIEALDRERSQLSPTAAELADFASDLESRGRPDMFLPFERLEKERLDNLGTTAGEFKLGQNEERGTVGVFDDAYDLVNLGEAGSIHVNETVAATAWVNTSKREGGKEQTLLSTSGNKEDSWRGIDFFLDDENHLVISLSHQLPDDLIKVRTLDTLRRGVWYQVGFSYDGSGRASGTTLYLNGDLAAQEVLFDGLTGTFMPPRCDDWEDCETREMWVGRSHRVYTGDNAIFQGLLDDLRIYYRTVSPAEVAQEYGREPSRDGVNRQRLHQLPAYRQLTGRLRELQAKREPYTDTVPSLMVMAESRHPRKTHVLLRGAYDMPGKEVGLSTPASILPWSQEYQQNRAGLADWLLSPENPLPSRVIVNRYWQLFFGQGIVTTPHDFGSQGSLPTHPLLLDYLASRLQDDWDLRQLIRSIVLSDTYRRSSTPTDEQLQADPDNLLLARGARHRLQAEMIRDNALAASGLLNPVVGGQSVKPYQPKGLWFEKLNFSQALLHYVPDHGDKLYRRSMYTFIRRTSPPPFMTTFDAGSRDICLVKRSETNTPLQALNLLNDPQFVEAARVLAQRVQEEAGGEPDQQLRLAYRLVTGRRAEEAELAVLDDLYTEELARFQGDREAAEGLLAVGEYAQSSHNAAHTAALTSVTNMLFSTDAAYVKY
ncbi:DUF1553 domain-containing protein [Neolewinella sp.]|uniref:DUF1553 domain-containing protein n=1 Tax=Neolewinella sp. TaxID=2993543 RepID=UPI003B51CAB4